MDLSKYQSYNESVRAYNELYKVVASKNHKWLHYGLLRIAGETRAKAYVGAGYKKQGVSYNGGNLDSTNAVHIEKGFPLLVDFIQIGKHKQMLKTADEQKDRIMSPEERMIMYSDIAQGKYTIEEKKKVTSIRKGKKVTTYKKFETTANLNHRMKALDGLNKMDGSYQQQIVIKKDTDADIKDMTNEELMEQLKQLEINLK